MKNKSCYPSIRKLKHTTSSISGNLIESNMIMESKGLTFEERLIVALAGNSKMISNYYDKKDTAIGIIKQAKIILREIKENTI